MNALTIASFTVQEAISRRLVLAAFLLSAVYVGIFTLGFSFLYGQIEPGRNQSIETSVAMAGTIMTVLGLYAIYFLSSFLALFLTVGAISSEIDSGTLHAVLARPIRRADLVLGRWLAYAGLVSAYVVSMSSAILLIARAISGYEPYDAVRTVGLMTLGAVLLLTISLCGSTLVSTLANGVIGFTLFGLAWLGGLIELTGGIVSNAAMVNLGIVISLLVPSDALWKAASFYAQAPLFLAVGSARGDIPFLSFTPPATPFIVWALLHPAVVLLLAMRAMARRDL